MEQFELTLDNFINFFYMKSDNKINKKYSGELKYYIFSKLTNTIDIFPFVEINVTIQNLID